MMMMKKITTDGVHGNDDNDDTGDDKMMKIPSGEIGSRQRRRATSSILESPKVRLAGPLLLLCIFEHEVDDNDEKGFEGSLNPRAELLSYSSS